MEYPEFIERLETFDSKKERALSLEIDDYSEMIFSTDYRRIFLNYNLKNSRTKLSVEVRATLPIPESNQHDQIYYTQQLQNMINLCNYLLELQNYSFIIDLLPEEGIWYATIEINNPKIDYKLFELLKIEKNRF